MDWRKSQDRDDSFPQQQEHLTSLNMEGTKLEDLTVRLGYPYLFSHHGNCEHLLVFADLR